MFVTNWISTTKIQKISEITNFFRHYFLSRTEVNRSISRSEHRNLIRNLIHYLIRYLFDSRPQNYSFSDKPPRKSPENFAYSK